MFLMYTHASSKIGCQEWREQGGNNEPIQRIVDDWVKETINRLLIMQPLIKILNIWAADR
jgi:hypothetical protein